ncbi:ABC transporter permease [candidate division KSB3 bacterium]|uniref:ABC transporter permease n=1 Tax=candidate division KSB3 bacterium TaxID=2044937 RepID=A0A2G6KEC6_9BACT|nr:MAG: ABC transporter permease [candidate division KSB3 bacterium]
MLNYILRRILGSIPVVFGISLVAFIIIQLPPGDYGDVYKQYVISQGGISAGEAEEMAHKFRVRYGLDKPLPVQYLNWITGIVTRGDFGYSFSYKKDVGELIAERLPRTILLAVSAHLISTVVGILLGIFVAPRQYSLADNTGAFLAFTFTSVPRFSLALIIMYLLVFVFGQEHVSSLYSPAEVIAPWSWSKFMDLLKHVWPVIAIAGLGGVARNMRVMRANLLDVLNAQYVQTARSKGLKERSVMAKHAVPNALHPIIMYQGMVLPYMIQGSMEAAIVLSLPTLGPMFRDSLLNQDIYISGSFLLIYGIMLIAGNLLADIGLSVLDPRIRYG